MLSFFLLWVFGFPIFTYYKDSFRTDLHSLLQAQYIPPTTYFCSFWILGWLVWRKENHIRSQKNQALPSTSQVALCKLLSNICIVSSIVLKPNQRWLCECSVQRKRHVECGVTILLGCTQYSSNILRLTVRCPYFISLPEEQADPTYFVDPKMPSI